MEELLDNNVVLCDSTQNCDGNCDCGDDEMTEEENEEETFSEPEVSSHRFVPVVLKVRETEDPNDLSHAELIEKQLAEIFGEDNQRYATYALGREPSLGEMILHYCQNGGPEDFERRHGRKTCIVRIEYE